MGREKNGHFQPLRTGKPSLERRLLLMTDDDRKTKKNSLLFTFVSILSVVQTVV